MSVWDGTDVCPKNFICTWVTSDFLGIYIEFNSKINASVQKIFGCIFPEILPVKVSGFLTKSLRIIFKPFFSTNWAIVSLKMKKKFLTFF